MGYTSEFNHISFIYDPANLIQAGGWEGNTFVTASRNKIVVLPTVDKELNCIYKSDVSVALSDGDSRKL